MKDLERIITSLQMSWTDDTAYESTDWSLDNPARGQCVVTALVVQDYIGGDLQRYEVSGDVSETHYANILNDGIVLDVTAAQYRGLNITLTPTSTNLKGFQSIRDKRLSDEGTRRRYELLRDRVASLLAE